MSLHDVQKKYTQEENYRHTREHVSRARTLLPDAYRTQEFFTVEQEQVFSKSWVCVGYTSQVRTVGSTFLTTVAGQSIFIIRDQNQKLKAFYNVCRHRGSQLLEKDGCYSTIRCPYHSWIYNPSGELLVTPLFKGHDLEQKEESYYQEGSEKLFCKSDYPLLSVKVDTWGCLIFVNLDPKASSLNDWLGDLPQKFARYPLEELELARRATFDVKANWKLIAENFMEYYHLPTIHPELVKVSKVNYHYRYQGSGMYMGFCTSPLSQDPESPFELIPPMIGLDSREATSAMWIHIFPNISLFLLPNHLFTLMLNPKDYGNTIEFTDLLVSPEAKQDPNYPKFVDEVFQYWDRVNRQDFTAVERVQVGLLTKAYAGGRMCERFEEPIHRFQNMLIDRMVGLDRIPKGDQEINDPYFNSQTLKTGESYVRA